VHADILNMNPCRAQDFEGFVGGLCFLACTLGVAVDAALVTCIQRQAWWPLVSYLHNPYAPRAIRMRPMFAMWGEFSQSVVAL